MGVDIDELRASLPAGVQIDREIHDGGQRTVYLARSGGPQVVLKLMPKQEENRAEREVLIGSTFEHPNLARILDTELQQVAFGGEEYVWFREEFIEGESLDKRSDTYEPCEALDLAADLTAAVSYLWERHSVVHRDIKPLNVIRRPDGSFVLIDVGIGRHQTESSITSGALGPGTRGHLAPEQLEPNKNRDFDVRTDLFLIGIVIFQVLTDRQPFRARDPEYEVKLLAGDWPHPTGCPAELLSLITRLLARHPHQRPTIEQTRQLIAAACEESGCS